MRERRFANIRLFGVVFACLLLGIAFSVNLIAGLVFFFILSLFAIVMLRGKGKYVYIPIVIITYLVGFVYSYLLIGNENRYRAEIDGVGYISGKVDISSRHDHEGLADSVFVLRDVTCNDVDVDGKVTVRIKDTKVRLGDRVSFYGRLVHRDLVVDSLGSTDDYNEGNRYISDAKSLDRVVEDRLNLRDSLVFSTEKILFNLLDEDTAGFLMGMLFGETSMLGHNVRIASRRLGIAHLFAVSGLHVGMIVGFLVMILNRLKVNKRYHLIILPFLIFYAYVCGFSVSVQRATIMVTLYLVANALFMRYDMVSSISLAGTILLLTNPMYLFDVSFVMSFLAVMSIALFSDRLYKLFMLKSERFASLKRVLSANIAVNIGLLPIMLYLFGGMSLLAIPANLIIIPLVTFIFPIFYVLFISILIAHLYVLIPIIALPFKGLVIVSKWLQGASFVGVYIDVSWLFVVAYIVVMILVSKLVFINAKVKAVPRILLFGMVMLSIIVPPIVEVVKGKPIIVDKTNYGYTMIYKDKNNRNVLAIMGNVDNYILDRAVANLDRHGIKAVDTIVIPLLSEEDIPLIEEYNESIGARHLVTDSDVDVDGMDEMTAHDYVMITDENNVLINDETISALFVRPNIGRVPYGYYDLVVTYSGKINGVENTKYYINFAKDSHSEIKSGFTFYIKNGKIISHNSVFD